MESNNLTREKKRKKQKLESDMKCAWYILLIAFAGALVALTAEAAVCAWKMTNFEEKEQQKVVVQEQKEQRAVTLPVELERLTAEMLAAEDETEDPVLLLEEEPPAARYELTDYERDLVERVVHAESANQGYDGQRLVAQCILDTAEARGMRPDAVVLEENQYAAPAQKASEEVKAAVAAVFDRGELYTDEPIRWFYAPKYSKGTWHESALVFVLEHGGHRFFKEEG